MNVFQNVVSFMTNHKKVIVAASSAVFAGAGAVMGVKAVTKMKTVAEELSENMDKVDSCIERYPDQYTEEDAENDRNILQAQAVVKSMALFLPTTVLVGGSLAMSWCCKSPYVAISAIGGSIAGCVGSFIYNKKGTNQND